MNSRFLTLTALVAVAAIALAWSAFAADDGEGGGERGERSGEFSIPVPPPPGEGEAFFRHAAPGSGEEGEEGGRPHIMLGPPHGPGGPLGGELTWGELHVQRDGEAVTMRVDHGELAAVDEDSITVSENDGNEVEIPVDDETDVHAGPFSGDVSLDDLEQGDTVHVVREEGQAAEAIGIVPERLEELREQMPAPPAAPGETPDESNG